MRWCVYKYDCTYTCTYTYKPETTHSGPDPTQRRVREALDAEQKKKEAYIEEMKAQGYNLGGVGVRWCQGFGWYMCMDGWKGMALLIITLSHTRPQRTPHTTPHHHHDDT